MKINEATKFVNEKITPNERKDSLERFHLSRVANKHKKRKLYNIERWNQREVSNSKFFLFAYRLLIHFFEFIEGWINFQTALQLTFSE